MRAAAPDVVTLEEVPRGGRGADFASLARGLESRGSVSNVSSGDDRRPRQTMPARARERYHPAAGYSSCTMLRNVKHRKRSLRRRDASSSSCSGREADFCLEPRVSRARAGERIGGVARPSLVESSVSFLHPPSSRFGQRDAAASATPPVIPRARAPTPRRTACCAPIPRTPRTPPRWPPPPPSSPSAWGSSPPDWAQCSTASCHTWVSTGIAPCLSNENKHTHAATQAPPRKFPSAVCLAIASPRAAPRGRRLPRLLRVKLPPARDELRA